MNLSMLGAVLLFVGLADLILAVFLGRNLARMQGEPPPAARFVVTLTRLSGYAALLAGVVLLLWP